MGSEKGDDQALQEEDQVDADPGQEEVVDEETEKKELMAAKQIELAMTHMVTRKCYNCGTRYVKHVGCSHVVCQCGAHNCYNCGNELGFMHRCEGRLSPTTLRAALRAAATAKKRLLAKYPFLRFKYDPSKAAWKRKRARKEKSRRGS